MQEYLSKLNPQQLEAATHVEGPLLILAGAGSGKTGTMTHRIAYMIKDCGISPYAILAVTFTNKAAAEMRDRVEALVGPKPGMWIQTFHSACLRILRQEADRLGLTKGFVVYDPVDQRSLIKKIVKDLQLDEKRFSPNYCLTVISDQKEKRISAEKYSDSVSGMPPAFKAMATVYLEYQAALKKNNAIDFDDMIRLTVLLFKTCPEVLEYYQNRFEYIMVDEYQDTNNAQFELIRLLAGKRQNLCVVGDDDQSIYKFRGANIKNILSFEEVFPGAKVVKLEQNYRSTQSILNVANAVIANNKGRKSKRLWTDSEEGEQVSYKRYENGREEAEEIGGEISSLHRRGKLDYKECAILYRTNAQSRAFEEAFAREQIPYNIVGGVNFYSRREIKDLLAYLKTVNNGVDDLAVRRIINVPKRGIGATSIQRVQDYADTRNMSFFQACTEADSIPGIGKGGEKIIRFSNMIRMYRTRLEEFGIFKTMNRILEDTGYLEEIRTSGEEDAEDRVLNIEEFLSRLAIYEKDHPEGTLSDFLEEVALVTDLDQVDEDVSRVLMMTVHSAKGLEFDRVYLVGMEDGVFPGYMSINSGDEEDLEEERRLVYVAITRARKVLSISSAASRMVRGETQFNPVSRFVREIPRDILSGEVPKERFRTDEFQPEGGTPKQFFRENPYGGAEREIGRFGSVKRAGGGDVRKTGTDPGRFGKEKGQFGETHRVGAFQKGMEFLAQSPDYVVGDRVHHIKFGDGVVLEIEKGPRDYQVTVEFDQVGKKVMYAAFARLVRID